MHCFASIRDNLKNAALRIRNFSSLIAGYYFMYGGVEASDYNSCLIIVKYKGSCSMNAQIH